MEPYLFFKGTKTLDLGLHMAEALPKTSPSPRYENVTVPGRDGTLTIWDGTYDIMSVAQEFTVKDMSRIDDISALFTGSGDLISSAEPEKRYLARVKAQGDLSRIICQWHRFTVQFEIQPFARERFPQIVDNMITKYQLSSLSVDGNYVQAVTHQRKNLCGPKSGSISSSGITCIVDADGTITLNGTATSGVGIRLSHSLSLGYQSASDLTLFGMQGGLPYTFSYTEVSGTESIPQAVSAYCDSGATILSNCNKTSSYQTFMSSGQSITNFHLYISPGVSFSNYKFRLQFEQSVSATPWEQFVPESPSPDCSSPTYGVTKITVNGTDYALPQTLYSLPDGMADNYDVISGAGTKKIGISIFNGAENGWHSESNSNADCARFSIAKSDMASDVYLNILFSNFAAKTGDKDGTGGNWYQNYIFLSVAKYRLSGWSDAWTNDQKVASFKTWLTANPVTVQYQLATSTAITGTPQTIISDSPAPNVSADNGGKTNYTLSVVKVPSQNPIHLYNIGTREAKPLIRLYGTGDLTVSVNGKDFTVKDVTTSATIDCESTEAYEGSEPLVTIGEFPTLPTGESTVSFTGATKIEITPNWRWI